ncbi:MAG: hypothetical protein LDL41_05645 [Coleofasciculus sp. S288]|nr:hypothetical protein [Coleofasciculus sp. S288]
MANPKDLEQTKDSRTATIKHIWAYGTGMLALCVIFSDHPAPPIVVASGAAVATAVVWNSDKKSQNGLQTNQLQQIEERLANLETIAGSGDFDLQAKLKQLESSHTREANSTSHRL